MGSRLVSFSGSRHVATHHSCGLPTLCRSTSHGLGVASARLANCCRRACAAQIQRVWCWWGGSEHKVCGKTW